MKKVLLLHYAAPPIVGGVESVMNHQAQLLVEDNYKVTLLAGRGQQTDPRISFVCLPLVDSRHPEILTVKQELDAGEVTAHFEQIVTTLEAELRQALAGSDVVIAHNVCSLNKNLPLTTALKRITDSNLKNLESPTRFILWHHDLAWTTPRYQTELHNGYPWHLLRTAWPGVIQVTVSESRRRELAELMSIAPEQINVVPNGVDLASFFKLEAQTQGFVQSFDLMNANPLLLLPVRITTRKNIELAIKTLAELKKHFPNAKLVVTGPLGPHNPANVSYFERLSNLREQLRLQEAVIFLAEHTSEYLPDAVIADFYRLADTLFFPSREEGFGIPVLEAGISGLPVFCADIPPLRALSGRFAHYFSPDGSPKQIAKLIEKQLEKDSGFHLRQQVKQNYTWQQIYSKQIKPIIEF